MAGRLKILLVEEARFFLAIEKQFLHKTPADLFEAQTSDAAIEFIASTPPDLIYMSYNLRPLNGAECCRHIRLHAQSKDVPIIMICDQDDGQQISKSQSAGCNDILTKPLDRHRFIEVGRKFLPGIREQRQTCLFQVEVTWQDETFRATCLDISSGGMFLDTQADIPVGSILKVSFRLPNAESTLIESHAEVMWLNRKPNPMKPHFPVGFGTKFKDLSERIKLLIAQNLKR